MKHTEAIHARMNGRCRMAVLILGAVLLSGCGSPEGRNIAIAPLPDPDSPPLAPQRMALFQNAGTMAQPVADWFAAVHKGDAELLATAFSAQARAKSLSAYGSWEGALRHYARDWRERFGNWELRDLEYVSTTQSADAPQKAEVVVRFSPPRNKPRTLYVAVVREGNAWRVVGITNVRFDTQERND